MSASRVSFLLFASSDLDLSCWFLFLPLDAFDVWMQHPPSTLISKYVSPTFLPWLNFPWSRSTLELSTRRVGKDSSSRADFLHRSFLFPAHLPTSSAHRSRQEMLASHPRMPQSAFFTSSLPNLRRQNRHRRRSTWTRSSFLSPSPPLRFFHPQTRYLNLPSVPFSFSLHLTGPYVQPQSPALPKLRNHPFASVPPPPSLRLPPPRSHSSNQPA